MMTTSPSARRGRRHVGRRFVDLPSPRLYLYLRFRRGTASTLPTNALVASPRHPKFQFCFFCCSTPPSMQGCHSSWSFLAHSGGFGVLSPWKIRRPCYHARGYSNQLAHRRGAHGRACCLGSRFPIIPVSISYPAIPCDSLSS